MEEDFAAVDVSQQLLKILSNMSLGTVGEAREGSGSGDGDGSTAGEASDHMNAALAAYSTTTPILPPRRLALTPDERTELE